ncbi:hypothetical protein FX988_01087 [Paraglaciecola mesophila]|uniref:Uncharacterized protein n=1 Tax=Paraglaciecola mesophila TaxID=197222 RepID=A0A857JFT2_9ALTE|nr:hypothetical protein FX988_01087 [Paraglaciecola mesophila]
MEGAQTLKKNILLTVQENVKADTLAPQKLI